jgi:hypothetical protein
VGRVTGVAKLTWRQAGRRRSPPGRERARPGGQLELAGEEERKFQRKKKMLFFLSLQPDFKKISSMAVCASVHFTIFTPCTNVFGGHNLQTETARDAQECKESSGRRQKKIIL